MPKNWVTYLPHFLDEYGYVPEELPASARRMFNALCDYIRHATSTNADEKLRQCFAIIDRKRCKGKVISGLSLRDECLIEWHCPDCGNHGLISGWQGTFWDFSSPHELQ